jgi:1-acyl-sn-glycerol-3-phosphate acyltransferase
MSFHNGDQCEITDRHKFCYTWVSGEKMLKDYGKVKVTATTGDPITIDISTLLPEWYKESKNVFYNVS